jgi:hypothetical protein
MPSSYVKAYGWGVAPRVLQYVIFIFVAPELDQVSAPTKRFRGLFLMLHGCFSNDASSFPFCSKHKREMVQQFWASTANLTLMLQMFLCATAKHCPLILHTFVEVFG